MQGHKPGGLSFWLDVDATRAAYERMALCCGMGDDGSVIEMDVEFPWLFLPPIALA